MEEDVTEEPSDKTSISGQVPKALVKNLRHLEEIWEQRLGDCYGCKFYLLMTKLSELIGIGFAFATPENLLTMHHSAAVMVRNGQKKLHFARKVWKWNLKLILEKGNNLAILTVPVGERLILHQQILRKLKTIIRPIEDLNPLHDRHSKIGDKSDSKPHHNIEVLGILALYTSSESLVFLTMCFRKRFELSYRKKTHEAMYYILLLLWQSSLSSYCNSEKVVHDDCFFARRATFPNVPSILYKNNRIELRQKVLLSSS